METYVCILLNNDCQIETVEAFSADTEACAHHQATTLVESYPRVRAYELWRKGKKINCAGRKC